MGVDTSAAALRRRGRATWHSTLRKITFGVAPAARSAPGVAVVVAPAVTTCLTPSRSARTGEGIEEDIGALPRVIDRERGGRSACRGPAGSARAASRPMGCESERFTLGRNRSHLVEQPRARRTSWISWSHHNLLAKRRRQDVGEQFARPRPGSRPGPPDRRGTPPVFEVVVGARPDKRTPRQDARPRPRRNRGGLDRRPWSRPRRGELLARLIEPVCSMTRRRGSGTSACADDQRANRAGRVRRLDPRPPSCQPTRPRPSHSSSVRCD